MMDRGPIIAQTALMLILITGITHADLISGSLMCFGETFDLFTEFNEFLAVAIILSVSLIAFTYMLGNSIHKPELTSWSKAESVTLVFSLILVLVVFSGFVASCEISNLLLSGAPIGESGTVPITPETSPADRALNEINTLERNYGVTVASDMVQESIAHQMNSLNYAYWSVPELGGAGLSFTANRRAWSTQLELLTDLYIPLMNMLIAQKMFFEILLPAVAGIILPAAIAFRFFFITRDVGNFLLALSFAIYFAMPLSYVFFFDATNKVQQEIFPGSDAQNPFGELNLGRDHVVKDKVQRVAFIATQAIIAPNLATVITITMAMSLNKAFKGMVG